MFRQRDGRNDFEEEVDAGPERLEIQKPGHGKSRKGDTLTLTGDSVSGLGPEWDLEISNCFLLLTVGIVRT